MTNRDDRLNGPEQVASGSRVSNHLPDEAQNAETAHLTRRDTMTRNQQALDAYITNMERAKELIARLELWTDDMGEVLPDDVQWPHVGDVAHVCELLEEAVSFVIGKEA